MHLLLYLLYLHNVNTTNAYCGSTQSISTLPTWTDSTTGIWESARKVVCFRQAIRPVATRVQGVMCYLTQRYLCLISIHLAMPRRVLKGKLCAKRRIGRPRLRWTDDVTDDERKMGIRGWTGKARNRDKWRLIVKESKAHPWLYRRAEEDIDPLCLLL